MGDAPEMVISSYVQHKGQTFRVSTINRSSSSPYAHGMRYAETMAWKRQQGADHRLVGQGEGPEGGLEEHFRMCRALRDTGTTAKAEEEET